ncbi:three-helix bundle dimerization domain-containing protein [Arthrobacter sp. TMN-37]
MEENSKDRIVMRVVDRLAARYPQAPRVHVEGIVEEEYAMLDGGRIRTYIPTLLEHSARDRIHREFARQHHDR